jgi:5-hydroxyisourate hydrolase-like protein (transthyretin family)
MDELTELRKILTLAEQSYKTAKTSLDGSLEYILAKEELKIARYNYALACRDYVEQTLFCEDEE